MSDHPLRERAALAARMTEIIERHVSDLRFPWTRDAAEAASYRCLADPDIAAGLAALPVLGAIEALHAPRRWSSESAVTVCAHCQTAWPCETRKVLDGELVTA